MAVDTLLVVLNCVAGLALGFIGIEIANNPPTRPWHKLVWRILFGFFGIVVLVTTLVQKSRNDAEQAKLRGDAATNQASLSNQLSNANGKLDAISHFEGQFLSFLSQHQSSNTLDPITRAYLTSALAIMKAASSDKQRSPRDRMLELSNEILVFVGDRMSVRPTQTQGVSQDQYNSVYHDWWRTTHDQYDSRFIARVTEAVKEFKSVGIDTYDADLSCTLAATPSLGGINSTFTAMQNCGKNIGALAEKMNF